MEEEEEEEEIEIDVLLRTNPDYCKIWEKACFKDSRVVSIQTSGWEWAIPGQISGATELEVFENVL